MLVAPRKGMRQLTAPVLPLLAPSRCRPLVAREFLHQPDIWRALPSWSIHHAKILRKTCLMAMHDKPKSTIRRSLLACLLAATASHAGTAFVSVDPATAVTSPFGAEFNTGGNFESWSPDGGVSGATISGGVLSGASTTTDPWIGVTNVASGPYPDLAFNDYLEIRMRSECSGTKGTAGVFVCSRIAATC